MHFPPNPNHLGSERTANGPKDWVKTQAQPHWRSCQTIALNVALFHLDVDSTGGPQALKLSRPESSELFVSNAIELKLATTELTSFDDTTQSIDTSIVNGPSIDPEQGMRPEIKSLYAVMKRISEGTSYEFTNYQPEESSIQPERNYTNDLDIVGVGREPTAIFLSEAS